MDPRKRCPPGKLLNRFGKCVPGLRTNPLGGPASSLWGTTGSGRAAPSPAIAPPGPAPVPPSCVTAGIFADCFPCTGGPITGAAPGPVCDWTFSQAFGPKGGEVSFSPGQASFNMVGINNVPAATSPISLATVNNMTAQWTFTEFAAPTGGGNSVYEFYVVTAGATEGVLVRLNDDGSLFVIAGPVAAAGIYGGAWTPNNGTHKVHLTVDGVGMPVLSIDDVDIPLAFFLSGPLFLGTLPGNVTAIFMAAGLVFPDTSVVSRAFIASGVLPSSTVFCCA